LRRQSTRKLRLRVRGLHRAITANSHGETGTQLSGRLCCAKGQRRALKALGPNITRLALVSSAVDVPKTVRRFFASQVCRVRRVLWRSKGLFLREELLMDLPMPPKRSRRGGCYPRALLRIVSGAR